MKKYLKATLFFLFSMIFAANSHADEWGGKRSIQPLQINGVIASVPTHKIIDDPEGDNEFHQTTPVDVTSVEGGTNGVDMTLKAVFSSKTVMNAVVGFVDIDADRSAATGQTPHANQWIPQTQQDLGVDYYLYLFDFPDTGMIEVVNAQNGLTMGLFPGVIQGQTLEVTFPVSAIGGATDVYIGTIFGNVDRPTDVAPKTGHGSLFGPGVVTISPSTSTFIATQNFDVAFHVRPRHHQPITFRQILFDGRDVTEPVIAAAITGRTPDFETLTFRLPNISARSLGFGETGIGVHTLSIVVRTPEGEFRDEAVYTVIPNNEP